MKWDDLRVFLQVARMERLVVAGKALGMDPATVGRRISALEDALGARLFDRSPQGYDLTDAGRKLVDHAQSIETIAGVAQEDVGGQSDALSGVIRIGAPDGVSNYLLTGATAELNRENPDLNIQIVALPRVFSLSQREADLTVTVTPPTAGRLKIRKISTYHLHVYAAQSLLNKTGPINSRKDMREVPLIGYISDMIFDKELDYLSIIGEDRTPRLTSNSLVVQLRWCLAGHGVCILPDFVAHEYPQLQKVMPDDAQLMRTFYLVRHQDDDRIARVSKSADVVAEYLKAKLASLPQPT